MDLQKVLEKVKKDDIKFITLQFTDLLGVIKEIIIPVEELEDASRDGVWFDGSSVEGFEYNVGPEPEFYLFRADGQNRTTPIDYGRHFDLTSHEGYKAVKKIIAARESFGIKVETSHREVGFGQYEIDFSYGQCLGAADKVLTLKYTASMMKVWFRKELMSYRYPCRKP
jgi:glutamine synthetase